MGDEMKKRVERKKWCRHIIWGDDEWQLQWSVKDTPFLRVQTVVPIVIKYCVVCGKPRPRVEVRSE